MRSASFHYDPTRGWPAFPLAASPEDETLVLVFGARRYFEDPSALAALVAAYPGAKIAGCSTAGEIEGRRVLDDTLSVAVAKFDATSLRTATAKVPDHAASRAGGVSIAEALAAPDLKAVLILSDGLTVNGSELLRGVQAVLPPSVVVTGGLAGDASRFERTWVLVGGRPVEHTVIAVGFYGDAIRVSHGSRGGWDIFGPERESPARRRAFSTSSTENRRSTSTKSTWVTAPPAFRRPRSSSRWRCARTRRRKKRW